jgi:hypothetical protein
VVWFLKIDAKNLQHKNNAIYPLASIWSIDNSEFLIFGLNFNNSDALLFHVTFRLYFFCLSIGRFFFFRAVGTADFRRASQAAAHAGDFRAALAMGGFRFIGDDA